MPGITGLKVQENVMCFSNNSSEKQLSAFHFSSFCFINITLYTTNSLISSNTFPSLCISVTDATNGCVY